MPKKITRSKRRELREKGQLKPLPKDLEARKGAERHAEDLAVAARVQEARDELRRDSDSPRESSADDESPPASGKQRKTNKAKAREAALEDKPAPKSKRDLTLLWLAALVAAAGVIFWLTQRTPTRETTATPVVTAPPAHTGPTIIVPPVPPQAAPPPVASPPAVTAAPVVTAVPAVSASVVTAAPVVSATPTAAPAAPTPPPAPPPSKPAADKPAPKPAADVAPPAPKPKPAPKKVESDPYG